MHKDIWKSIEFYKDLKKYNPTLHCFLKQEKLLRKFAKNSKYKNPKNDLLGAFTWRFSPEGEAFWCIKYSNFKEFEKQLKNEL